ncbi:methyl-accepting chemotaxis protein [Azospirillum sp.]|uniref:methyl-accepting chemotaxis protein n=1 Tax=Azospirillum sp. TaxID=34012 RepID=UPI003D7473E7
MLENRKVGTRVALGFGVVVMLLAALGGVSWYEAAESRDSVGGLADQAVIAELVSRADGSVLRARLASVRYIYSGGAENAKAIPAEVATARRELTQARALMKREVNRKRIDEILALLDDYERTAAEIATAREQREAANKNVVYELGSKLRGLLIEMRDAEVAAGHLAAAAAVSRLAEDVWTARILVFRILDGDTAFDFAAVRKRVDGAAATFKDLAELPLAEGQTERIAAAGAMLRDFSNGLSVLETGIATVNQIRDKRLAPIGRATADKLKEAREVATARQGEMRAAAIATSDLAETAAQTLTPVAVLLACLLAWAIGRGVSRPVVAMTGAMERLARGDTAVEVPAAGRRDEIGQMAAAVQVFKDNLIRSRAMEEEVKRAQRAAEEEKRAAMRRLADSFEASIKGVVAQVSAAASQMQANSRRLTEMAEDGRSRAATVMQAAGQASANVQTVAASAEEMTSSISEISRQVNQSGEVARRASQRADDTTRSVQALAEQARGIGDVVELINSIASQTNLLALNATIEAARAGETGKGFAVVASEVKSLANQTAKATEEIAGQITGMQEATRGAVGAIGEIAAVIAQINEIATTIAAAVEEQDAATREIARSVHQAAQGTEEISRNIGGVQQIADGTGSAAHEALGAADTLFRDSERLSQDVDRFIAEVRAS